MLDLETSQIPIKHVISVRRLMYWHTLLKTNKEELTNQIHYLMKSNPLKDDWIYHVVKDLKK